MKSRVHTTVAAMTATRIAKVTTVAPVVMTISSKWFGGSVGGVINGLVEWTVEIITEALSINLYVCIDLEKIKCGICVLSIYKAR